MVTHSDKKSARKTTELRQAPEAPKVIEVQLSDPSERPTKSGLESLLARTTRFIGNAAVILLLAVVVSKIVTDMWNRPLLIDPLIVPKAMEDQGYTGLVAANRMADEIVRIEQATKTFAPKDKFMLAGSEPLPDIEIPETKLSLVSAIGFLEDFLHVAPPHVSAELIFESGAEWHEAAPPSTDMERVVISVRIIGRKSHLRWTEVAVHSPDEAVTRAAREVLEMTNPYILGLYSKDVEHDRKTALLLIQEANEIDPSNPYVYLGWGSVLDEEQDYAGAIAKYQKAIELDPKFAYAYNNWGTVLDEEQDHAAAVAKYRKAIELDPKYTDAYYNCGNALYYKQDYRGPSRSIRRRSSSIPNMRLPTTVGAAPSESSRTIKGPS